MSDAPEETAKTETPAGAEAQSTQTGGQTQDQTVRELMNLYARLCSDPALVQSRDALTQALVTVQGSGPSFGALASMMAASNASGLMYYNAVANQQKTNLLGMAMTAKCVRAMLDSGPNAERDLDNAVEETAREQTGAAAQPKA